MAVRESVTLDLRDAERAIAQLERDLDRAVQEGARSGGRQLVTELRRGESVRLNLPAPNIDTSHIPAQISGAVDRADTGVVVTATAADVTPTIDAAVNAADNTIDVKANVSGGAELAGACASAECVDKNLKQAQTSSDGLSSKIQGLVQLLSLAAAAKFFRDAIDAASDLGEAVNKVQVVFGEAAGSVLAFGQTAATQVGLSNEAALSLTSQFGILAEGAGLTQDAAADLSLGLVTLSGDIASLQNVSGGAAQVSEALGAALRGEYEPARAIGLQLSQDAVNQRAYAEGIAATGTELSNQQRILATYSEIQAQAAVNVGDFQNTITSVPNALRVLQASFTDTEARIGQQLLPTIATFITTVRTDLLPAVENLGVALGPALIAGISAVIPVVTIFASLLSQLAPTIEAFALGVTKIPAPLLAFGAAALILATNLGVVATAMEALATATPIGLAFTAAAAGAVALGIALGHGSQQAAEQQRAIDTLNQTLFASADAYEHLTESLTEFLATSQESAFASAELQSNLLAAGISFETLSGDLANGQAGYNAFIQSLIDSGDLILQNGESISDFTNLVNENSTAFSLAGSGAADYTAGTQALIDAFNNEQRALVGSSEERAKNLVLSNQATQAQLDYAVSLSTSVDGVVNWAAVLARLGNEQRVNAASTDRLTAAALAYQRSLGHLPALTDDEATAIRDLRGELDPANQSVSLTSDQIERLANVMANGSISTQQFAQIAADFGVTTADLAAAESDITDQITQSLEDQQAAIDSWADTLMNEAPTATAAFQEAANDLIPGADIHNALIDFQNDANAFALAQATLASLTERGFTGLATFLATQPPAIINQASFQTDEALTGLETMVDDANTTLAGASTDMTANAASLATGVSGGMQAASDGVTAADLPGTIDGTVGAAADVLTDEGQESDQSRVYSSAKKVGNAAGHGLIVGLNGTRTAVLSAYRRLGEEAADALADGAGVHSPSVLTMQTGRELARGLELGFTGAYNPSVFATVGSAAAGAIASGVAKGVHVSSGASVASAPSTTAAPTTITAAAFDPQDFTFFVDVNLDGQPVREMAQATVSDHTRQVVRAVRARPR